MGSKVSGQANRLIWDQAPCHTNKDVAPYLKFLAQEGRLFVFLIPGGLTSVLQACDLLLNALIKKLLKALCEKWRDEYVYEPQQQQQQQPQPQPLQPHAAFPVMPFQMMMPAYGHAMSQIPFQVPYMMMPGMMMMHLLLPPFQMVPGFHPPPPPPAGDVGNDR